MESLNLRNRLAKEEGHRGGIYWSGERDENEKIWRFHVITVQA
jgi:hypothetical protein